MVLESIFLILMTTSPCSPPFIHSKEAAHAIASFTTFTLSGSEFFQRILQHVGCKDLGSNTVFFNKWTTVLTFSHSCSFDYSMNRVVCINSVVWIWICTPYVICALPHLHTWKKIIGSLTLASLFFGLLWITAAVCWLHDFRLLIILCARRNLQAPFLLSIQQWAALFHPFTGSRLFTDVSCSALPFSPFPPPTSPSPPPLVCMVHSECITLVLRMKLALILTLHFAE